MNTCNIECRCPMCVGLTILLKLYRKINGNSIRVLLEGK